MTYDELLENTKEKKRAAIQKLNHALKSPTAWWKPK